MQDIRGLRSWEHMDIMEPIYQVVNNFFPLIRKNEKRLIRENIFPHDRFLIPITFAQFLLDFRILISAIVSLIFCIFYTF